MGVIEIIMKTSWGKVLAVLMLFVVSCGKDSKNPLGQDTSPTVKTEQAKSSVITDEIGGVSLTVISAYEDAALVAENKTFSTEVSKKGTQLLFITDENQQLRGMTISVVEEKGIRILVVDATSTAYSLLLLTPGITTTSPAETRERLLIFDSLNSFHLLVAHLKEHLVNKSLPTVVENETTQQLLVRCIEEYTASISGSSGELFKKAVDFHDFYINRKVDSKGEETVELKNYGWRHVHVRRKDFAGIGATSVVVVRNNMKGVEPHSSGAYIWWIVGDLTAGNPTVLTDETYPPGKDLTGIGTPSAVTRSEYWIYGPGFKENNLSMPLDVQLSMTVAGPWVWTIYSYIIKPLLGLTGGIPIGEVTSLSDLDVVSAIENSSKAINNLNQLLSIEAPLNWADVAVSLTNTTISMVEIAAKTVGTSLGWKFAAAFFVGGNFGFSVANLWDAVPYLMGTPRVLQQELQYQVQPQTYTLSGRILENGSGLTGVTVSIAGTNVNGSTTTNSSGEYYFTDIPNGTYTLTASKSEYTFTPSSVTLTVNGANATVSDIAATKLTIEPIILKHRLCPPMNRVKEEVDLQIEANLGKLIKESLNLKMRWISFREAEGIWSTGYLDVQDYAVIGEHLWAVGDSELGFGFIFYSSDGGKSWEIQWRESRKGFSGSFPFVVYFSTEKEGWVGCKSGLYCTQDGGRNWEFCEVPGEYSYIAEYWFYQNKRIDARYAYGRQKFTSLDGGKTWDKTVY